jgi:hypothetical protein
VLDHVGQRPGHDEARARLDLRRQPNVEPRELAHGILPSVLTRGGLQAGVYSLVARLDVPVRVDVTNASSSPSWSQHTPVTWRM